MKWKKLLALLLTATLLASILVFSPVVPISAMDGGVVSLLPTQDTFVALSDDLLNKANGGNTLLEIGYHPNNPLPVDTGYRGGSNRGELMYARDILMQFDLGDIPAETVSSAVLRLTIAEAKNISTQDNHASSVNLAVFDTDDNWTEDKATWNNAPAVGELAGISQTISNVNSSQGSAVLIDLTSYIRQHPKKTYSFRIKTSAAGFNFYSKEAANSAQRPALEISYDGQLRDSHFDMGKVLSDTYIDEAKKDDPLDGDALITVAADKTVGGSTGAMSTRHGFIKVQLPTLEKGTYYDSAKITFRVSSTDNANLNVSAYPVSSDWDGSKLTWSNAPEIGSEAIDSFIVPNNNSSVLNYFTIDIADYANNHPSEDGVYAVALSTNTAIVRFFTTEDGSECNRPKVECIYREKAYLTLHYIDPNGNDIIEAETYAAPVGQLFAPVDHPKVINEKYYFSSELTAEKNAFPYTVTSGENHVYLVYENKAIRGYEEIEITTVQYEPPVLPERILVHFDSGSDEYFPVSWSELSSEALAQPGPHTVIGTIQGIRADAAKATVNVQEITAWHIPSIITTIGIYPPLPLTITATVDDGTKDGFEHDLAVEWDDVPNENFTQAGSFVVNGRIVSSGQTIQVTVTVEEEGRIDDRIALADTYSTTETPTSAHGGEDMIYISGRTGNNSANANYSRNVFLRFKGGDFGGRFYDELRGEEVDTIVSATVRLYFNEIHNNAEVTYSIYAIPEEYDNWSENSLTWNNSEDIVAHGELVNSIYVRTSTFNERWIDFNVTKYVQDHREDENLSFFITSNLCKTDIASRAGGEEFAPHLHITNYIPDSDVTLRYMAKTDGGLTDIAEPLSLRGKLGQPFKYQGTVPSPIYLDDGAYYYRFLTKSDPPVNKENPDLPPEDPDFYISELKENGNEIVVMYERHEITKVEPVEAETWQGTAPTLPETVKVYLDNGAELIRNVIWDWDAVNFTDYSTKGSFTMTGAVMDITGYDEKTGEPIMIPVTDVPAKATISVKQAWYSDPSYPTDNRFDMEAATAYRLSFDLINTDDLQSYLNEIFIYDGDKAVYAYDMSPEEFSEYLSSFKEGQRVEVFFTTPESASALTLSMPDCVNYMVNAQLCQVMGRGGDMTVHYLYKNKEIYSQPINIMFGESFSLPEEYFTVLNGVYYVYDVDADRSDITKLTDSVVVDRDDMEIYLICEKAKAFTLDTEVENVYDYDGNAYTRSTVTAYNGTSDDRSAVIFVAKFSPDGTLLSVKRNNIEILPGAAQATVITESVPVDDDSYTTLMVWNDITGLQPFIPKVDSRNPTGVSPRPATGDYIVVPAMERNISYSSQQSGNEAVNILTRDLSTRWSAQATGDPDAFDPETADPVSAVVDLNDLYDLHTIGLGFYQGRTRRARFSVEISADGETWSTLIWPRYSSGKTNSVEYFTFEPASARYVRINGYGWKANEITDQGLVETSGDWFSVTAFEAYGSQNDFSGAVPDVENFEGLSGKLNTEPTSKLSWGADALNEMTYTNYTPALGGSLYAEIAKTPDGVGFPAGNTALHLYDNVDRDGKDGAGSVGAYHRFTVPSDKYTIRFKWYVPNTIEGATYNSQWAGVTLSSGRVKGGADTSNPVAFQMRLSPSGKNKMAFNIMRTITYNEGNQSNLLGSSIAFNANCVWDVALDVDSASNSVVVTVSDGTRTESAFVRYNLYNSERTMSQTWSNNAVNYIMFNTGAGGKCEMYVDDFSITPTVESDDAYGERIFSQDYNDIPNGTQIRGEAIADTTSALIKESGDLGASYTPSYGSGLDVTVATQSRTGGRALLLMDNVGRETNSSKGAGGVFAYVDLPKPLSTKNVSKITFDMYAPTAGEYSGFALGSGHNEGGDDQTHPLALQARFSPQSEGMQFNSYSSIQYNKGSQSAFVGTGSNRLDYGKVWSFEITVNPVLGNVTVKATDGSKMSTRTISMPTSGEGGWKVDWSKTTIDTLIFNTGAGTSSEIYIDNIEVYDTGISKNSYGAVNGLVRYESDYGTQGYFMVHAGQSGSRIGVNANQNPYYNRFVERKGLADPDSVSIEVIGLPNYYIVPATNGAGTIITVQKYQDTDEFRRRATFNKVSSLSNAGKTAYSYQWYVNPELYLRVNSTNLELSKSGDSGLNKACTWHLRNEANNYVSDSFDGTSLSSQWYKGYPWYANYHNHSAVHRNENVVVSGGRVLLKATKRGDNEWIKNSSGATGYSDSINGGTWKRYAAWTGVISVNNKVYNKGSYIEGSFKQPNSPRGYWTAFWLNGRDSWPPETDMFEYLSSKGTSTWYTATHGGSESANWYYTSGNLRTQYHTFSIDWGYDYIKMYVNGSLYFSRQGTSDVSTQKNMYLILNTGIGAWESEPDGSTVWGEGLECQWIRSYQYY